MIFEKVKRKRKRGRKSLVRFLLIALMMIPAIFFVRHPAAKQSLLVEGIALSVMISAAVYILQQGILTLIAAYLGLLVDDTQDHSTQSEPVD